MKSGESLRPAIAIVSVLYLLPFVFLSALSADAANQSVCPKEQVKELPLCSTEKVNNSCVVNIDRRYPITMPTFQMHPCAHVRVEIHNAFRFETLTLDPQTAQALQASDQGAALITQAIPNLKGLQFFSKTLSDSVNFAPTSAFKVPPGATDEEKRLIYKVNNLQDKLNAIKDAADHLPDQLKDFDEQAGIIYSQLREILSPVPRPVRDSDNQRLPGTGVPQWSGRFDPWSDYSRWRSLLLYEFNGGDGKFQPPTRQDSDPEVPEDILSDAKDLAGELPVAGASGGSSQPFPKSAHNLFVDFESDAKTAKTDIDGVRDSTLKAKYQPTLEDYVDQEQEIARTLAPVITSLTKVVSDLQSFLANIDFWTGDTTQSHIPYANGRDQPLQLGLVPDPVSPDKKDKDLVPYKALGRQITYTVNAVNQIATSSLSVPTATQKTAIVTITVLYADPKFEVSAGAFASWLANRSFANFTDVKKTSVGSGSPVDIKISQTVSRPELLPFVAANYRLGRDFVMPGRRRGAVYGTLAIALNPYNQLPEFAGGFSLSWRSFMFSPLYHLGHGVHLTQGESVGELWCVYGAPSGSVPPACAGSPPAPSTKMYWTGAFALGISIRVPTTFGGGSSSSSSH